MPALFTSPKKEVSTEAEVEIPENVQQNSKYEYKQFATVKLLHTSTGEIEEVALDEYLYNVVSSEMPADFEQEALKAQAVVARTYTIYQITHSSRKT